MEHYLANVIIRSIDEDSEVYQWLKTLPTDETILLALQIGQDVIKKVSLHKIACEGEDEAIKLLQEENLNLVKLMEDEIAKRVQEELHVRELELSNLRMRVDEKNLKIKELDAALKAMVNEFCEGELKKLRQSLQERETEIKTLRNMNSTKGLIGEMLIMDVLRDTFSTFEVENVGKMAHECDIHMHDGKDGTFVFESKYKNSITKNDLEKFYTDMQGFDETILGGIFISINTRNIPGKGCMRIEMLESGKPVMFLGFEGQNSFMEHFPDLVLMFVQFAYVVKQLSTVTPSHAVPDVDIDEIFESVQHAVEQMMSNTNKMSEFKTTTSRFLQDLEDTNKGVIANLVNLLGKYGRSLTPQAPASNRRRTTYTCEICKKEVFTNKKHLQKHMRSCLNAVAE